MHTNPALYKHGVDFNLCMSTHMFIHTPHTHVHTHYTHTHTFTHTTHTHTFTHTTHTCSHTLHTHVHTHMFIHTTHTCSHTLHTHMFTHTLHTHTSYTHLFPKLSHPLKQVQMTLMQEVKTPNSIHLVDLALKPRPHRLRPFKRRHGEFAGGS